MVAKVQTKASRYQSNGSEPFLNVSDFTGLNYSEAGRVDYKPGQLAFAYNIDLYDGYFTERRGTTTITSSNTLCPDNIVSYVEWIISGTTYLLFQGTLTNKLNVATCTSGGGFTFAKIIGSATDFTFGSSTACDMVLSNGRLYLFHPSGNYICEYSAGTFYVRTLGVNAPTITSVASGGAGAITGEYVWGVELVYQVSSVDKLASTPSRQLTAGGLAKATLSSNSCNITVDSTSLPTGGGVGDYWTHVRLYRSKRLDADYSDPTNPIDAAGTEFELYPVKLVTRSALASASYIINDNATDDELDDTEVWDIDRIELEKIPACRIGCVHAARVWVSGVLTEDPDDCDVFYSNYAGTKYSEQYKPTQRVKVDTGDSQQTIKLISFESDLVIIKQAKTGIIQGGEPNYGFEVKDHNVGTVHRRLASYIPGIGIVAITNDTKDLKVYGYDHKWGTTLFGQDISRNLRSITSLVFDTPTYAVIQYINGKLFVCGAGTVFVMHIHSGKGWTQYDYYAVPQALFRLSNTNRWAMAVYNNRLIEVECESVYTTYNLSTGAAVNTGTIWQLYFKSNQGNDLLEYQKLTVNGVLAIALTAVFYTASGSWESATAYASIPDPTVSASATKDMPYEIFATPRPVDNILRVYFYGTGRLMIRQIKMDCFITPNTSINRLNRITNAQVTGFIPTGFSQ